MSNRAITVSKRAVTVSKRDRRCGYAPQAAAPPIYARTIPIYYCADATSDGIRIAQLRTLIKIHALGAAYFHPFPKPD